MHKYIRERYRAKPFFRWRGEAPSEPPKQMRASQLYLAFRRKLVYYRRLLRQSIRLRVRKAHERRCATGARDRFARGRKKVRKKERAEGHKTVIPAETRCVHV